jgi:ADP-heptose:LPS heptosyltransferase
VLYVGEPLPDLKVDKRFVKLQFLNSSLRELFSWIAGARCVVTMDSSPLWVSHFTKTPVIAILGPSRPAERLKAHPLYPEGAVAIELNKELKCEPCFEIAEHCKRKFDCLKTISPERLYELIQPHVMRFITSKEEDVEQEKVDR